MFWGTVTEDGFFSPSNQYDVELKTKKACYFASGALAVCVLSYIA